MASDAMIAGLQHQHTLLLRTGKLLTTDSFISKWYSIRLWRQKVNTSPISCCNRKNHRPRSHSYPFRV